MPKLTYTEEQYLKLLQQNPEGVSRGELSRLKGSRSNFTNVVDVHMKNLRQKLAAGMTIRTIRGFGYKLETTHS